MSLLERSSFPRSFFSLRTLPFVEDSESCLSEFQTRSEDVDLTSDDKNQYVTVAMPGVNPEDIDVSLEDGIIWIKGVKKEEVQDKNHKIYRKSVRNYSYRIELPEQIDDRSEPKAAVNKGLVKITLPKAQTNQSRKITVKGS